MTRRSKMISDGEFTKCAACGWCGQYDPDCDCLPCNQAAAEHMAQHTGQPQRKPMQRVTSPRRESTLNEAIKLRA